MSPFNHVIHASKESNTLTVLFVFLNPYIGKVGLYFGYQQRLFLKENSLPF